MLVTSRHLDSFRLLTSDPQLRAVSAGVKELLEFKPRLEAAKKKRQGETILLFFVSAAISCTRFPELEVEREQLRKRVRDLETEQAKLGDASTLAASLGSIGEDTAAFSSRLSQLVDVFAKVTIVSSL